MTKRKGSRRRKRDNNDKEIWEQDQEQKVSTKWGEAGFVILNIKNQTNKLIFFSSNFQGEFRQEINQQHLTMLLTKRRRNTRKNEKGTKSEEKSKSGERKLKIRKATYKRKLRKKTSWE